MPYIWNLYWNNINVCSLFISAYVTIYRWATVSSSALWSRFFDRWICLQNFTMLLNSAIIFYTHWGLENSSWLNAFRQNACNIINKYEALRTPHERWVLFPAISCKLFFTAQFKDPYHWNIFTLYGLECHLMSESPEYFTEQGTTKAVPIIMMPLSLICIYVCESARERDERDRKWQRETQTHQVLFTQPSELLKFLRHEELSTAYCTAHLTQH